MADLDVSMAPYQLAQGNGGGMDIMGTFLKGAYMQNAMNQNKLFQQEFAAKKAIGPIAQSSVDPKTGQMDWDKFALGLSTNSDAAFMAPQILESLANQRKINLEITAKNLENNQTQLSGIANLLAPLVAKGNPSMDDILGVAKLAHGQGIADNDHIMSFLAGLPDENTKVTGPDGTPQSALSQYVKGVYLGASNKADTLGKVLPQLNLVRSGNGTYAMGYNQANNTLTPAGGDNFIPDAPSASQANELVPIQNPDGSVSYKPRYQVAPMVTGAGGPAATNSPQSGGINPQGAGATSTPTKSIDPETQTFLSGRGGYMVNYANGVDEAAHNAQTSLQTYNSMLNALGKARMGGGGELRTEMAKFAQGIQGLLPKDLQPDFNGLVQKIQGGTNKDALAYAQEFEKYASIAAMQSLVSAQGSHYRPAAVEYTTIFRNFPRLATDPKASRDMIQLTRSFLEQNMAEQKYMHKFTSQLGPGFTNPETGQPYKVTDWPAIWSSILSKSGRLGLEQKYYENLGGKNFGLIQKAANGGQ